jgi:hypothetical protein
VPPPPPSPPPYLPRLGAPSRATSIVRTRIEPKTFFSNERTFLAWLQIGVLVLMTGLGLLTGSTVMTPGSSGPDACSHSCRAAQVGARTGRGVSQSGVVWGFGLLVWVGG